MQIRAYIHHVYMARDCMRKIRAYIHHVYMARDCMRKIRAYIHHEYMARDCMRTSSNSIENGPLNVRIQIAARSTSKVNILRIFQVLVY
jgi:queuine/archaeosine tRNA-ribosyltransferase